MGGLGVLGRRASARVAVVPGGGGGRVAAGGFGVRPGRLLGQAAAGGLWLCRVRPCGLVAVVVPSGFKVMAQPQR